MTLCARLSLFNGSFDARPVDTWELQSVLAAIRTGTWREDIATIRALLAQGDTARSNKKTLPAFTFGGTFSPTRNKNHLQRHSGLVHFDYDHIGPLVHLRKVLCAIPSVAYLFTSPSGHGLKVGVRVPMVANDSDYKHAWQCAADSLEKHAGLVADPSGKDIGRLCFTSHDEGAYLNLHAEVFPVPPMPAPLTMPPVAVLPPLPVRGDRHQQYLQHAIGRAITLIATSVAPTATTSGNRHRSRLKAARLLGGYVAGGFLTYEQASATLERIVARHTDHLAASMRTIRDGLRYGMRTPVTYEQLEAERLAWCAAHGYATSQQEGS